MESIPGEGKSQVKGNAVEIYVHVEETKWDSRDREGGWAEQELWGFWGEQGASAGFEQGRIQCELPHSCTCDPGGHLGDPVGVLMTGAGG